MANYEILIKAILDKANLQTQITQVQNQMNSVGGAGGGIRLINAASTNAEIEKIKQKVLSLKTDVASFGKISFVENSKGELTGATAEYRDMDGMLKQMQLQVQATAAGTAEWAMVQEKVTDNINQTVAASKKMSEEGRKQNAENIANDKARATAIDSYTNKLKVLQANSKTAFANPQVKADLAKFNEELGKVKNGAGNLDTLKSSYDDLNSSVKVVNKTGNDFLTLAENAVRKVLIWAGATTLLYGSLQQIEKGIQYIKDLDKELTNISVVTGQSNGEVGALARGYNELATQLSSTTLEITKGSLAFIRQGKSAEETATLIRNSTIMSKLANLSAAESSEYLTSVMNGFKMTAEETTAAVDAMVAVDNAAATSVKELAEALQRTSSTAQMSGVEFNDLVAYIGTVSSVTRKSAIFNFGAL